MQLIKIVLVPLVHVRHWRLDALVHYANLAQETIPNELSGDLINDLPHAWFKFEIFLQNRNCIRSDDQVHMVSKLLLLHNLLGRIILLPQVKFETFIDDTRLLICKRFEVLPVDVKALSGAVFVVIVLLIILRCLFLFLLRRSRGTQLFDQLSSLCNFLLEQ